MAVPTYDEFFVPTLLLLVDGKQHGGNEITRYCADYMKLSEEERQETLQSERGTKLNGRTGWARTYLKQAGLISSPKRAVFEITDAGRKAVDDFHNNITIDLKYLEQFSAFKDFLNRSNSGSEKTASKGVESQNSQGIQTPYERIDAAFIEVKNALVDEVLDNIMRHVNPYDFERLVVQLLLKMGYGDPENNASAVTVKSGDSGIDGIITSDKLGFDSIYIQAKRWDLDRKVGRPDLQAFVGACIGASKLVFITTAGFTKEAIDYANQTSRDSKRIVLINGQRLAELMIEYDMGVSPAKTYTIKHVDSDFFEEYDNGQNMTTKSAVVK